ncbi:MAG: hypothetical protein ACLQJR_20720 [Stellaceae bacterium]
MTLTYFSPLRRRFGRKPAPPSATRSLDLHVGDWIEVRPLDEVLATLDAHGCLDAMPFMAEMARFCGQRFQVFKTAHKSCDTIYTFTGRRLENTVHLAGLRCDGGFHGGCQAGCLLFWKEAWLRRVDGPHMAAAAAPAHNRAAGETEALSDHVASLARQARIDDPLSGEPRYRCQATELLRASTPLNVFDPRHYLRDLSAGNLTLWTLLHGAALSLYDKLQRLRGARRSRGGTAKGKSPVAMLNLQPGELVQVRSKAEIMATLDDGVRNRGLSFDGEMAPYCGRTLRVLRRVDRILDEKTGKMLKLRKDCIILEDAVCSGLRCGIRRLGCPKSVYPYWREAWLRRVESAPGQATPTDAPAT